MQWLRRARIVVAHKGAEPLDLLSRDLNGVVHHSPNDAFVTGGGGIGPEIALVGEVLR